MYTESRRLTHLGDSMSGTCRKLELFGLCDGLCSVGTARARISATETCGEPKPVLKPYSISWNTLRTNRGSRRTQTNGDDTGRPREKLRRDECVL